MPGFRHMERTPGTGRKKRHPLSVRGGFAINAIDAATAYPSSLRHRSCLSC